MAPPHRCPKTLRHVTGSVKRSAEPTVTVRAIRSRAESPPESPAESHYRHPPSPHTRVRRVLRRTREGEPHMAKGIRFHETGGPEVLRWEAISVGEPGPGEVRVRHVAVGLNFADTYFRTGLYPAPLPAGMGVEAAGVVEAVGPGVADFAEGDRVTYTGSPLGAYSTERVMDVG